MKISTKGEYGIRAMLYIAMHSAEDRPVTSHEIAAHQGVPEPYLRQILALLSKDRLIASNRGPHGGHLLARPAQEISLREILMTLEGRTTSIDQILDMPCTIDIGTEYCVIREFLLRVKQAVEEILSETSLGDLAERQRHLLKEKIAVPLDVPEGATLPVLDD